MRWAQAEACGTVSKPALAVTNADQRCVSFCGSMRKKIAGSQGSCEPATARPDQAFVALSAVAAGLCDKSCPVFLNQCRIHPINCSIRHYWAIYAENPQSHPGLFVLTVNAELSGRAVWQHGVAFSRKR
jgi:hypothetical protein